MPHLPTLPPRRTVALLLGAAVLLGGGIVSGALLPGGDDRPPAPAGVASSCLATTPSVSTVTGRHAEQYRHTHDTGALSGFAPDATVQGLRIHNYGDGIRVLDGAEDVTILDVHLSFIRDDCIENDDVYGGTVRDALLDGCYVAFSARPWSEDFAGDGGDRTWSVVDSLIRLQPMPTVYRGDAPGHGGFFKWDHAGRSPRLRLHGNVFRADQDANHTTMGIPPGSLDACSDNVMVCLGEGPYPAPLPDCFRITTDPRVWDDAVASWMVDHRRG